MRINKLLVLFLLIVSLTGCGSERTIKEGKVQSTDLRGVSIENMKIRDSIYDVDLSKYGEDNLYEMKKNTYDLSKLRITTDANGSIVTIEGDIEGYVNGGLITDGILYNVNGESLFYTIDEIIEILGGNYNDYWYDKERYLRATTFTDMENQISLTFIYYDNSKNFASVILSESNTKTVTTDSRN